MNITDIRTCDRKPYENSPRLNEDAVDLVAASIDEFGAYGSRTARTEVLHDGV